MPVGCVSHTLHAQSEGFSSGCADPIVGQLDGLNNIWRKRTQQAVGITKGVVRKCSARDKGRMAVRTRPAVIAHASMAYRQENLVKRTPCPLWDLPDGSNDSADGRVQNIQTWENHICRECTG